MQFLTYTADNERMENSRDTNVSKFIYYNLNELFDEDEQFAKLNFEQFSNRKIQWRFEQEVAQMVQHLRTNRVANNKLVTIYRITIASMISYNFNISVWSAKWVLRDTFALEKIAKDYGGVYTTAKGARLEFEENNTCSLAEEVL